MTEVITQKLKSSELEAEIYYLTTEEGGRENYVTNGYRGQFYYNGRDWDASQEFIEKEICNPGETVKVYLQTLSPDFHIGQFSVGQIFEIREGAKAVGKGKITKILRPDFNYWDFDSFYNQLPKTSKPYDDENIQRFLVDFDWAFEDLEEISELRFQENLSNKNEMLEVECILKNKKIKCRPLIDKVCEIWREKLSFEKSLYKVAVQNFGDKFEFQLSFATWHDMYLTGKIVVKTI
ncbi:hypothetical protein [Bacteroides sp. 224]|uniref:EF-Tu C-terminal domain-related protein n=1 Tax=Bacteroides sp. 224 TaxID=2302936 RepID=UPI0013D6BEA9|nr:hypothetical protein [Bacteroides sp. 224]NDV66790.1 hypothetical protein [Bacteroides sp. 224]